ncbi:hypothetical protein C8Q78DRAFT_995342 [Trametes maxima]|nr:hypothetical protein C8Q78DRAFT_995342 [Trametes maxima]
MGATDGTRGLEQSSKLEPGYIEQGRGSNREPEGRNSSRKWVRSREACRKSLSFRKGWRVPRMSQEAAHLRGNPGVVAGIDSSHTVRQPALHAVDEQAARSRNDRIHHYSEEKVSRAGFSGSAGFIEVAVAVLVAARSVLSVARWGIVITGPILTLVPLARRTGAALLATLSHAVVVFALVASGFVRAQSQVATRAITFKTDSRHLGATTGHGNVAEEGVWGGKQDAGLSYTSRVAQGKDRVPHAYLGHIATRSEREGRAPRLGLENGEGDEEVGNFADLDFGPSLYYWW